MLKLNSLVKKGAAVLALAFLSQVTIAASGDSAMLESGDFVGYSFWLISMALAAATVFFLMESMRIGGKWATSLTVSALVTFIAAFHYFYMREVWVSTGTSPTDFRYIDWLLTVPLLMIEFYLILAAIANVSGGIFWRLLVGTLVMLVPGYMGEAGMDSYFASGANFMLLTFLREKWPVGSKAKHQKIADRTTIA